MRMADSRHTATVVVPRAKALVGKRAFLVGGGRAAASILAHDWTKNPLGPIEAWPQSLRTALGIMLSSRFPKTISWGPECITFHNDAFEPILGEKPDAMGRPLNEVWIEAWQELKPLVDKAYAGEPIFLEDYPLVINRHGYPEEAFFTFCYSPLRDEAGDVAGMMDTVIETTETVLAQRQLALVNSELAHRMRNMLTMVTAIADMSLRHATTLEEGRSALGERLVAFGNAQSSLIAGADINGDVAQLAACALDPHVNRRHLVHLHGPPCQLNAKAALALALAINELLTNSIKYGALKVGAHVAIDWGIDTVGAGKQFHFTWRESGAKPPKKRDHEGFGTKVLTRFVPLSFQGKAAIDFNDDGLVYQISAPCAAACLDMT